MSLNLEELIARERECSFRLCEAAGVTYPGDPFVARAVNNLPELSPNWRFVPEGINQVGGLKACQLLGIKLYGGSVEEAGQKGRDNFTTQPSLIHADTDRLFLPTDLLGRPFNLTLPQQIAWAAEQEGQGLMFASEVLFLWARCALEERRALWAYGAVRCADVYDSVDSLRVYFDATGGLVVYWCLREHSHGHLGAVARKVIVLGS